MTWLFVQGKTKKNGRQSNTTVSQDKTFPQIMPFTKPEAAAKSIRNVISNEKKKKCKWPLSISHNSFSCANCYCKYGTGLHV